MIIDNSINFLQLCNFFQILDMKLCMYWSC